MDAGSRTASRAWRLLACFLTAALPLAASARTSPMKSAVEVGPGIDPPRLVRDAKIEYPPSARADGVSGTVVLRVCIDANGKVRAAEVVSSPDPRLSRAAREAALDRRYAPATKGGRPVAVWWRVGMDFRVPPTAAELDATCDAAIAGDTGPVELSDDIVQPVLIKGVEPGPAWEPGKRPRSGKVTLSCVIDACGRVTHCAPVATSGASFTRAALEAVGQWRYEPARRAGRPVSCRFTIHVSWR